MDTIEDLPADISKVVALHQEVSITAQAFLDGKIGPGAAVAQVHEALERIQNS